MSAKRCPVCPGTDLQPTMTKQGVEIDFCSACGGIWLDEGEIYHFIQNPKALYPTLNDAIQKASEGRKKSPVTGKPMLEASLQGGSLKVDYCSESGGFWFDANELKTFMNSGLGGIKLTPAARLAPGAASEAVARPPAATAAAVAPAAPAAAQAGAAALHLLALPNLALRSVAVMGGLYGMLALLLIILAEAQILPPAMALIIGIAIALFQFLVSPFIMDLSLQWLYRMRWVSSAELPAGVSGFIQSVCQRESMRPPRIGIIDDGAPNAFTYGHTPNNARVVLTRGMFDLLDENEVNAVVAHEIGHARHWDILLMTIASLVPLILYYIYRTLARVRARKQGEAVRIALVVGAYLLYIISEYLVLWFSRTREYYADRFAGEATGNPSFLASALVKIGYGLAGKGQTAAQDEEAETPKRRSRTSESRSRNPAMEAIGAMGIFDANAARSLAIVSSRGGAGGGQVDRDLIKKAARWDLWNPWATYYELHSTHPLIANRLKYLSNQASVMGRPPYVVFDEEQPESFWDEFLVDIAVAGLPLVAAGLGLALYIHSPVPVAAGIGVILLGTAMLVKTLWSYRAWGFPNHTIASLLGSVKVSAVRPVPCTLRGQVIGKGVPGLIWSEDFVMQDKTGIIFLDYRQPLRIWEWLFGLIRAGDYQGREVIATGWYRRAPVPYVELKSIQVGGVARNCYVYTLKLVFAFLAMAGGLVLMVGGMAGAL